MKQIFRRTSMPKCIVLRHGCSPVKLQAVFRTLFPKYTSGGLLLEETIKVRKFANNWPNLSTWRFIKCNSIHIYNQINCVAIHLKIRVGCKNSRNTIRNPKIDIISTTLDLCVTCLWVSGKVLIHFDISGWPCCLKIVDKSYLMFLDSWYFTIHLAISFIRFPLTNSSSTSSILSGSGTSSSDEDAAFSNIFYLGML